VAGPGEPTPADLGEIAVKEAGGTVKHETRGQTTLGDSLWTARWGRKAQGAGAGFGGQPCSHKNDRGRGCRPSRLAEFPVSRLAMPGESANGPDIAAESAAV